MKLFVAEGAIQHNLQEFPKKKNINNDICIEGQ